MLLIPGTSAWAELQVTENLVQLALVIQAGKLIFLLKLLNIKRLTTMYIAIFSRSL